MSHIGYYSYMWQHNNEKNKPDTKKHVLYDSHLYKLKNGQH